MLLLDIDEVLMGWKHHKLYKPGVCGWEEWRYIPNRIYFNVVADDMLGYLKEHFEDRIVWLTTWLTRGMCNTDFAPETNFGPFPTVTSMFDLVDGTDELDPNSLHPDVKYYADKWWKLNYVCHLIQNNKIPDKVIWIDDDIAGMIHYVNMCLMHYGVRDRFYLISPIDALTRNEIEAAREWYYAEATQETVE